MLCKERVLSPKVINITPSQYGGYNTVFFCLFVFQDAFLKKKKYVSHLFGTFFCECVGSSLVFLKKNKGSFIIIIKTVAKYFWHRWG